MGRWEYIFQHQEHQDYYKIIKDHLGIEPEFRDLISYRIIASSEDEVKRCFEYYKEGWALLGKDISNYSEVYDEFFNVEESGYIMSTEEILRANDSIEEYARDPNLIVDYKKTTITHFNIDENDTKSKTQRCVKCNKVFNTISNNVCNACKKDDENFKWGNPFSSTGVLYLGIAVFVLFIIFPIMNYYSFLILGAIALFLLMYFQDKSNK